jgi:hypothetical protein
VRRRRNWQRHQRRRQVLPVEMGLHKFTDVTIWHLSDIKRGEKAKHKIEYWMLWVLHREGSIESK